MSSNSVNEDLRSIKTKKALYEAMFTLLKKHSFRKLTIKGICEQALISRAAFYAHFIDKYDLLEHSMSKLLPKGFNKSNDYEQIESEINALMQENKQVLENLIYDADKETLDILFEYILSTMNPAKEENDSGEINPRTVVLSNFYTGGIIYYLYWQIKNKFPANVPTMNRHLFEVINTLKDLQPK